MRVTVTVNGYTPADPAGLAALTAAGHEVSFRPCTPDISSSELATLLAEADAVVAATERYDAEVFSQVPTLRHLSRIGVGLDAVDLDAADAAGVIVTIAAGANDVAVADHAMALLLAVVHGVVRDDRAIRGGSWREVLHPDVTGSTLGLVGLGRIGREVARRAGSFGMTLLGFDPHVEPGVATDLGVRLVGESELLAASDVVSLHLPLLPATRRWLNADRLALLKRGVFVVNTARGGLVDEDALYDALVGGQVSGAALDVREVEPTVADRFAALDSVVLTPHSASLSVGTRARSSAAAADAIILAGQGQRPPGLVTVAGWERQLQARAGNESAALR